MAVALIQVDPPLIMQVFGGDTVNINVPGKWQAQNVGAGYQTPDGNYQVVTITPFVPPDGQMAVGPPTYTLAGGAVSVSYSTIPIPAATFIPYATFVNRLTDVEYTAIKKAIATAIQNNNATVARWYDLISNTGIDTTLPQTTTIKNLAVSQGLLTQARANVVFTP